MRVDARILPMGRLDELDLSLSLSRTEEAERLSAAQRRLLERFEAREKNPTSDGSGRLPKAGERRSVEASAIGGDS